MRITYLMLFLAFAGFGANAQALTIATVDMPKVMSEAQAAKSAKKQLEAKQKEFQSEVSKTEAELQKNDQDLAKQRSLLSADAFKDKLTDFREKAASAQKDVQGKRLRLRRAFEKSIVTIQTKVTSIIADIAKERSYSMVIPSQQLLYHDQSMDITEEVLSRLDGQMPSLNVDFAQ